MNENLTMPPTMPPTIPLMQWLKYTLLGFFVVVVVPGCTLFDFFYDNTDARVLLKTPSAEGAKCVVEFPDQRKVSLITPDIFTGSREGHYRIDITCEKSCYVKKTINVWMPEATSSSGNYYTRPWNTWMAQYLPEIALFLQPEENCTPALPFSPESYIPEQPTPQDFKELSHKIS